MCRSQDDLLQWYRALVKQVDKIYDAPHIPLFGAPILASARIGVVDGHAWMCSMGKLPCRCTSMGWDGCCKNWGGWRACLNVLDGQITLPMHIYGLRWMHRTWDGTNQPSSCQVRMCARIGVADGNAQPEHTWQETDLTAAHLEAAMIPQNLKWSKSAQQLWSYSIHKVWLDRCTDERTEEQRSAHNVLCFLFHTRVLVTWRSLLLSRQDHATHHLG